MHATTGQRAAPLEGEALRRAMRGRAGISPPRRDFWGGLVPTKRWLLEFPDAWRSVLYECELVRLRPHGNWAWSAARLVVAGFALIAGALLAVDMGFTSLLAVGLAAMPLGAVVIAAASGARAFGEERERGTLDALLMTPIPRAELVAARFRARTGRPLAILLIAAAAAAVALMAHEEMRERCLVPGLWSVVAMTYWLFTLAMLACSVGLQLGLRVRAPALAMLAAVAAALAAALIEAALSMVLNPLMGVFFLLPLCGLANLSWAGSFLRETARRFDDWAIGRGG